MILCNNDVCIIAQEVDQYDTRKIDMVMICVSKQRQTQAQVLFAHQIML